MRYDEKVEKKMTVVADKDLSLDTQTGDAIELEITFEAPLPKKFGLKLLGDDKGENAMRIVAGAEMKKLMVGNLDPEFALKKDEDLTLRIFIDKNMVEVFANDRQASVYPHRYYRDNPNIRLFTKDSDLVVKETKAWKMKSIYTPAE